jgi:hypothetical protein
MVTSIAGTCIFLSPFKSSISDVEITREDSIRIEINDFKITVRNTVIPLSVIVILIKLIFNLNNAFPLLVNGINIEIKRGNKKIRNVLFIKSGKLALKAMAIKMLKIK